MQVLYQTTIFSENGMAHSAHYGQTLKGLIWSIQVTDHYESDVMYCTT